MGTPKFYYFPEPDGRRLETIDLGETLAEMFHDFEVDSTTAVSFDGAMFRKTSVHREIITIQRDRFTGGEDLAIKFEALQNHLDRGFSCSFASDSDKAYCFPVSTLPTSGDQQLITTGDPFRSYTGGFKPAIGDFVSLVSQNPELLKETNKVSSLFNPLNFYISNGGSLDLENKVAFTYSQPSFVHHYRFFPVLKRPQEEIGKNIITNEGGRLFSLNLKLVVDYATLFSHHPQVGAYERQVPSFVGGEMNLDRTGIPSGQNFASYETTGFSLRRVKP